MTHTIRVLLVEDNPGDADLTRDTLESGALACEIDVVADGEAAVAYLDRAAPYEDRPTPDVVILDLNLPKRDGREVLQEIRKREALRALPFVVLTSSDAPSDVAQSYRLGANCYVTKPVDLQSYRAVVRSIEGFWFSVVRLP